MTISTQDNAALSAAAYKNLTVGNTVKAGANTYKVVAVSASSNIQESKGTEGINALNAHLKI